MKAVSKLLLSVLSVALWLALEFEFIIAQENIQTPSHNTKQALEKLTKTPATIGKSLEALTGAANARLKQVLGDKPEVKTKVESDSLFVPPRKPSEPESPRYAPRGTRDPFRPYTERAKSGPRQPQRDESLPPILRYDIAEFKLVGIAGYERSQEWKALVLAPDTKSYTLSVGMDIGTNKGTVKAINRSEVVFEENPAEKKSKNPLTWNCIVGTLCSKPSLSTNRKSG